MLVRLEELAGVNDRDGLAAGDRLLQLAGRDLQRMAARAGGTAYRAGGRRLAVLAPLADGRPPEGLAADAATELAGRAATVVACAAWRPGDRGEDVLDRARSALRPARPATRPEPGRR